MRPFSRVTALLLATGAALLALPTHAETFDLDVRAFCPPGTNCGYASQTAYEAAVLAMVQELNVQWRQSDYSFRPVIYPIDSSDPQAYNVTACDDKNTANPLTCSNDPDDFCNDDGDCSGSATCEPRKVCGGDWSVGCNSSIDCLIGGPGGTCELVNKHRRNRLVDLYSAPERDAITLFLFNTGNWCCSNPPDSGDSDDSISSIFCVANLTPLNGGSVYAHEMGHYWCLRHTFTHKDFVDTAPNEPPHNGDTSFGINDTPADPSTIEDSDRSPRCSNNNQPCEDDGDCTGSATCNNMIIQNGRDICQVDQPVPSSDTGSTHGSACTTTCSRCQGGDCGPNNPGSFTTLSYDPFEHNSMSYYGSGCVGPFTKNGSVFQPYTSDQLDEIDTCRVTWQRRIDLPDVCANKGGDWDRDGICQLDDNCDSVPNINQTDGDGDGIGDVCDLCPDDPAPTGDIDGDGIGDICDPDMDDDGCLNDDDQHPMQGNVQIGTYTVILCGNNGSVTGFEGNDSDGDGFLNCEDPDDDNDGLCDDAISLPPGTDGAEEGCVGPDPCPTTAVNFCNKIIPGDWCVEPWRDCLGSGCVEHLIRWESLINPAPENTLIFESVAIINQTLYLKPPLGMTPAQIATQMSGLEAGNRGPGEAYRVELWKKGGDAPVAVLIDRYVPNEVTLGSYTEGDTIVLHYDVFDEQETPVTIYTQYGIGADLGDTQPDRDGDRYPDFMDNCREVANDQSDRDRDGFGDACDADVDNDGRTTDADLAMIGDCVGVVVDLEPAFSEPGDYDENGAVEEDLRNDGPTSEEITAARRCLAADLDGDGRVTEEDAIRADEALGTFPGPAGALNRAPVAEAGPHQVVACGSEVTLDAGASFDADGDTLTCSWGPSTCTIADPTKCQTTATCPAGGIHSMALTVSDGTTTDTDGFLIDAAECSPGRLLRSDVRLSKILDATGAVRVQLAWPGSCRGQADFAVYEGALGDWQSLQAVQCGDPDGDHSVELSPRFRDSFFLIVPMNDQYEGSFGEDSSGTPRVGPADPDLRCRELQAIGTCSGEEAPE